MDCEGAAADVPSVEIPLAYLKSVVVNAYHLDITMDVERATYSGFARIVLDVMTGLTRKAVGQEERGVCDDNGGGTCCTSFYFHAAPGLQLSAATVNGTPGAVVRSRSSLTHVTRIEVPREAAPSCGGTAVIEVTFSGCINKSRTDGLYMTGRGKKHGVQKPGEWLGEGGAGEREDEGGDGGRGSGGGRERAVGALRDYATDSVGETVVLGTHLEPTRARELFPCVDLPSAKAVFHLTLRGVPRHLQAMSNTPVLRSEDEANETKAVTFRPTPRMPTYVFGFWVGDFHCISARALATSAVRSSDTDLLPLPPLPPLRPGEEDSSVLINVHFVKGVGLEGAEFALDLARRSFELFSRLFPVRFPMPKLDVIGLPGPMHGIGMENFGAITCLQVFVLYCCMSLFCSLKLHQPFSIRASEYSSTRKYVFSLVDVNSISTKAVCCAVVFRTSS